jgi:hypothetical protein
MPFTGTPSILQLSAHELVIHGLSLASDASERIGLFRSTLSPEVQLPQSFFAETAHHDSCQKRTSCTALKLLPRALGA